MTTQADLDLGTHKVVHDERVKEQNRLQRILIRPEMGALIGAIGIFIFFAVVAPPFRSPEAWPRCCTPARQSASWPVAVGLLMIGGEFDLSAGVAVTTSALAASMLAYNLHLNLWVGAALALVVSLAVGFLNGYLVMKTKIPSFLITLSTFLMLTGINLAVTKLVDRPGRHVQRCRYAGIRLGQAGFSRPRSPSAGSASASPCCGGSSSPLVATYVLVQDARSATGSSPSAATWTVPGRSACR